MIISLSMPPTITQLFLVAEWTMYVDLICITIVFYNDSAVNSGVFHTECRFIDQACNMLCMFLSLIESICNHIKCMRFTVKNVYISLLTKNIILCFSPFQLFFNNCLQCIDKFSLNYHFRSVCIGAFALGAFRNLPEPWIFYLIVHYLTGAQRRYSQTRWFASASVEPHRVTLVDLNLWG